MFIIIKHLLSIDDIRKLAFFINYFTSTWLEGSFPITMWNKCGCDKHHRTNNAMENWHGRLNKVLPKHPNIFVFISALKQDNSNAEVTMAKATTGQSPPKGKPKYQKS